jgi:D-3-phosphoglycerate dehydrogenase / 2-oxoglutarate reductase
MRPRVLLGESQFANSARAVLEAAGEVLDFESRDAFAERLPQADAVVLGLEVHLRDELLARADALRVIASRTSQLRHIDLDEARRRGIAVLSIDAQAPVMQETSSTAEVTIALLLSLVRNIPWAFESVKAERWERFRYGGSEVRGKTIGIVGFGRLGRMVAAYAQALGMRVLAHDRPDKRAEIEAHGAAAVALERLLRESDVVSLHCTWSEETRGLIGRVQLELMQRGAAIDTLAGEQPDGSHVRGNPLVTYARTHENLIVLPHLGGATVEATERTQVYISEKLAEWLRSNA